MLLVLLIPALLLGCATSFTDQKPGISKEQAQEIAENHFAKAYPNETARFGLQSVGDLVHEDSWAVTYGGINERDQLIVFFVDKRTGAVGEFKQNFGVRPAEK